MNAAGSRPDGFDAVRRAWLWWSSELISMLPDPVRDLFSTAPATLNIRLEDSCARIELCGSGVTRELTVSDIEKLNAEETEGISALLEHVPGTPELALILSGKDVLHREILLPMAVENNLESVLKFEIDRLTPFSKDDACFGYRFLQRVEEHEKIKVELYAVHRQRLAVLLEAIEKLGLSPEGVYPPGHGEEDDDGRYNLLPEAERAVRPSTWDEPTKRLGLVAVSLLVLVLAYPAWQLSRNAESLREEIAAIRAEATRVADKRASMSDRLRATESILARKGQSAEKLQLLYDLTRTLPDNTWVSRLKIDNDEVVLQGESRKATDLIELLEQFEKFRNVQFQSSINRNSSTNMEQYEIHMELVEGAI